MDEKALKDRSDTRAYKCSVFMNERVKCRKKTFKQRKDSPAETIFFKLSIAVKIVNSK